MSTSVSSKTEPVIPESNHRQLTIDFVRWALAQLAIEVQDDQGLGRIVLAEQDRDSFGGQDQITIPFAANSQSVETETLDWNSRFVCWLLERVQSQRKLLHVHPRKQPVAVNAISQRLLDAYQIDGGQVHLGGCQLTDFPFLRLSFADNESDQPGLRHVFVAHDGSSVSDELAKKLELHDLERYEKPPARLDDETLNTLVAAGKHVALKESTSRDPAAMLVEPVLVSIVWIKQASGLLQFTIDETTESLAFSGWASLLEPRPFLARESGAESFHLAATDDGRIDAFDQISTCHKSGKRVLHQELVSCSVTNELVLPEYTKTCPVSGLPALLEEFHFCQSCQQSVSKAVLEDGICSACQNLVKTKKDDPRLVWILGEHTGLENWRNWKLAETEDVYIAQATGLLKRLMIVVDKETLEVHHLATASRFGSSWLPVSATEAEELL